MDALGTQMQMLRQTIDACPVGAAAGAELTLEDEIRHTAKVITLTSARLLVLEAQDMERKIPRDRELLDLAQPSQHLDEYTEEMARASLLKLVWKTSVQASVLRKMIAEAPQEELKEKNQTLVELLTEMTDLQTCLRFVLKERREMAQQIVNKKQELLQSLQSYKELLVSQETERQERATGLERENMDLKRHLAKKLEKLNVMRLLMINMLGLCNINYIKEPKWTQLLVEKQGLLTVQSLADRNVDRVIV